MCTNRTSPECPKHPVQPLHHTLVIRLEPYNGTLLGCNLILRKPEVSIPIPVKVPPVFKTGLQAAAIKLPICCCSPRTRTSITRTKTACPAIRRGNKIRPICQRTFSFEVSVGTDPTTQLYKSRIFPVKLKDQIKTKNPNFFFSSGLPFVFYI